MDKEEVVHVHNGILGLENKCRILKHICGIQKNGIDELMCQVEIETQPQRKNVWIPRGKGGGRRNWEIGIDTYTLLILCIKQTTNENLLYSTGNSTQYSVTTYMGIESKKQWIYVYVQLITLLYSRNEHNIVSQLYSNKKIKEDEVREQH